MTPTRAFLSRAEAAEYVRSQGLPLARGTLQKYAFSGVFADVGVCRSQAQFSRAFVPPVNLACTSSRRRIAAKRFGDRLCTASVLAVNERTG